VKHQHEFQVPEQHRIQKNLNSAPPAVELLRPPPAIPLLFYELFKEGRTGRGEVHAAREKQQEM
jgi:hypothetical protein